jgi:hypothetical protein
MALPQPVASDLWVLGHPFRMLGGIPLGTRSTIVRLSDGRLWLHSPGPLSPELRGWLEENGPLGVIVAPNLFHHLYLAETIEAFPGAEVFGPPGLEQKTGIAAAVPEPSTWESDLTWLQVEGCPKMNELVFLHPRSRTLVLTDLAFHFREARGFGMRLFLRLTGVLGRFRSSRLARSYFFEDHARVRQAVEQILRWDFDRIIVAHGEVVERDGRETMRQGFDWLLD